MSGDRFAVPEAAQDPDDVLEPRGGHPGQPHDVEEGVETAAEAEREPSPDIRCTVVAKVAVSSGCRVFGFVAAVAIPIRSLTAAAAPTARPPPWS